MSNEKLGYEHFCMFFHKIFIILIGISFRINDGWNELDGAKQCIIRLINPAGILPDIESILLLHAIRLPRRQFWKQLK